MCEEVPRQKAAESRKIPESGSVIPREGVERKIIRSEGLSIPTQSVIPREGVERLYVLHPHALGALVVIPREGVESTRKISKPETIDSTINVIPR